MIEWIENNNHFDQIQKKNKKMFVLFFYAGFSSFAKQALFEIEQFCKENKEIPVYIIDVEKVKGVHKQFGVENVPTVVAVNKNKIIHMVEGIQSAQFYNRVLAGIYSLHYKSGKKAVTHRVTVYSGPGCPACGTAKSYLRRRGVYFRDVDISRDQHAAESLVRRSGQMAVPQIDIDGHLIIGFDRTKIDQLLSN